MVGRWADKWRGKKSTHHTLKISVGIKAFI